MRIHVLVAVLVICLAPGCSALSDWQQTVLYEHNRLRCKLAAGEVDGQPRANNVNTMVWDDTLASVAQAYAESCSSGHNSARHDQYKAKGGNPPHDWVGENVAGGSSGYDIPTLVAMWWDEHKDYTYSRRAGRRTDADDTHNLTTAQDRRTGGATGHYTQMAWATSTKLGCGFVSAGTCGGMSSLVCNYVPGGPSLQCLQCAVTSV